LATPNQSSASTIAHNRSCRRPTRRTCAAITGCPFIRPIAAFVSSRYGINPPSNGGHRCQGPRRRCRRGSHR
jgi:hypothetical protein